MTATPTPELSYRFWHDLPDGSQIVGHGPLRLYDVREVRVDTGSDHLIRVWAIGRMLRKDGLPGPRRSIKVRTPREQPAWLDAIIADADRRLTPDIEDVTFALPPRKRTHHTGHVVSRAARVRGVANGANF